MAITVLIIASIFALVETISIVSFIFYSIGLSLFILIFVSPFLDWLEKGFEDNKWLNLFLTIINFSLAVLIDILLYFVFMASSLEDKPYYLLLNKVLIVTFTLISAKIITYCCLKIIDGLKSGGKKSSVITKEIASASWLIILTIYLLHSNYKPEVVLNLKDIKIPLEFKVEKIKEKITTENLFNNREIVTIRNTDLINKVFKEIDQKQFKNTRNLDEFNFELTHGSKYPYYRVIPVYEGLTEIQAELKGLNNGYIYRFEIYGGGQIVITGDHLIKHRYLRSFYPRYRVNLSDNTKKDLINALKALE